MPQEPAPGTARPGAAVEADPTRDVPEADGLEQSLPVTDAPADAEVAGEIYRDPMPAEANPDDVYEQRLEVPMEDDDYPPT